MTVPVIVTALRPSSSATSRRFQARCWSASISTSTSQRCTIKKCALPPSPKAPPVFANVIRARDTQLTRFSGLKERLYCNAQLAPRHIRAFCELSTDCERVLERGGPAKPHRSRPRPHIKGGPYRRRLGGSPCHRAQTHWRSHPVPDP